MKKKVFCAVLVFMLLLSTMLCIGTHKVEAESTTVVYVDPEISYATVGQIFSINVSVANVIDLYGFELKLGYNTTFLDIVDFCVKPFLNEPTYIVKNETNEDEGWYWLAIASLGPIKGKNGNGTLVTLTFNFTDINEGILDLETKLVDSEAYSIPHMVVDGHVEVHGPAAPKATFACSPIAPFVNQTVTFDASDSTPRGGEIVNYTWNFGYGSTVTEVNPTTTYVYAAEGIYLVTLTVIDSEGFSGTASKSIEVFGPCGPTAKFTYSPKNPLANETVTFDASVSELGWNGTHHAPVVTYEWKFGDGTPSLIGSDPVATAVFVECGDYVVTLNVTDTEGRWNSTSCMLHIFSVVSPSPITAVYVEPPYYYGEALGDVFTVEVIALNVHDVLGFEFKLDYDPSILDAIDITLGPFLNEPTFIALKEIYNDMGKIWFGASSLGSASATGSGVLAAVTFEVTGVGLSVFSLRDFKIATSVAALESPEVLIPTIHNIAIVSATPSATEIYARRTVNITAVVKNSGNAIESFNVTVYCDTHFVGVETVANLTAGGESTLIFNWNTAGVKPCRNYTIKAEVSGVSGEISTADNTYSDVTIKVKMMGDVDGNDIIDINDVVLTALSFGSTVAKPNIVGNPYDPRADLNNDGIVDIVDLIIIGVTFGKTG